MRAACARKLQLGMQRSAGTGEIVRRGENVDGSTRFRDYNFTINENSGPCKSIIVIARIRNNFRVFLLTRCNETEEKVGGRRGARTPDPRIANAVLSQLS